MGANSFTLKTFPTFPLANPPDPPLTPHMAMTTEQTEPAVTQHYVVFLSPGTFMAEDTRKAIDAWDVERAQDMAAEIVERHGARPYGFYFVTRGRGADDLDSRELTRSCTYFLGGTVRTVDEVRAAALPSESILLSNMTGNGYSRVIENRNSWKWTQPLGDNDVVLQQPEWAKRDTSAATPTHLE